MAQDGFDGDVSGSSDPGDGEDSDDAPPLSKPTGLFDCRMRGPRFEVSFATAREPLRRLLLCTVALLALATRLYNIDVPAAVSFVFAFNPANLRAAGGTRRISASSPTNTSVAASTSTSTHR